MNLQKAAAIKGWMSPSELFWLACHASSYRTIAEIGSWMGRSTRALADNTRGVVYAVDTWQGSEEHKEEIAENPENHLFKTFCDGLADHLESGRVVPMRMPSVVAATQCAAEGKKFGIVFIDAAHDYENVRADIAAWKPLVRKGGLLCGHDYDGGWPGVTRAVQELVSETPHVIADGSIWFARL